MKEEKQSKKGQSVIALVGRPNVGKSSIFNTLYGKRLAIIDPEPGVTRDRLIREVEYFGKYFTLIDTGGLEPEAQERAASLSGFGQEIQDQAHVALADASAIIFCVDGKLGLLPGDYEIADLLRHLQKPVYVAVNKCDNPGDLPPHYYDFYELGFADLFPVSASHRIGFIDLCDKVLEDLAEAGYSMKSQKKLKVLQLQEARDGLTLDEELGDGDEEDLEGPDHEDLEHPDHEDLETIIDEDLGEEDDFEDFAWTSDADIVVGPGSNLETKEGDLVDEDQSTPLATHEHPLKLALLGKPNVGKSSLFNRLVGENRSIVSNIAGTTRDLIDYSLTNDYGTFDLLDTAGMRRQAKIKDRIERFSILRSQEAAAKADVALLLIDASEGKLSNQDSRIAGIAHNAGIPTIVVANKWDIRHSDYEGLEDFRKAVLLELPFMASYLQVTTLSALTGKNVDRIFPLILKVAEASRRRLPTGALNEVLREAVSYQPPPQDKGKHLNLYYTCQVAVKPPTFLYFINSKKLLHFSYERYLENNLRHNFDLDGTPIKLLFREKEPRA